MIELHLVLKAPPNKIRILSAALQALAKSSRVAPGCMAAEIYKTVAVSRYICYD
jgi:quinol monooxygenase YgiN